MVSRNLKTVLLVAIAAALAGHPAQAKPFFLAEMAGMTEHQDAGPAKQAPPVAMVKRTTAPSSCCQVAELPSQSPSAPIK
ncbi:MAG: hypothetical protein HQL37_04620 [Alphaproteobacteria bacterium]|nr:hypothetical protein [Alphaproteobacteria bacterium]